LIGTSTAARDLINFVILGGLDPHNPQQETLAMNQHELSAIARAMVAKNKGILAADESTGTIGKRFSGIKLESTEENRRTYREMLFTTPGASDYISGVIMYDETIHQKTKEGVPFPAYLAQLGILPGIKVDTGAKPLAGFPGETITEGHDGLRERLAAYHKLGARFAKWRAVIDIGAGIPTAYAIDANAAALARYAALCQEADIVPIVEPEVLMDGAHSLERCEEVTGAVLDRVFGSSVCREGVFGGHHAEAEHGRAGKEIRREGLAGTSGRGDRAGPQAPCARGGAGHRVSVGRPESVEATQHLHLINARGPLPWAVTFSYGRACRTRRSRPGRVRRHPTRSASRHCSSAPN
jgi:fructose-bisphosphate aldolase, class I